MGSRVRVPSIPLKEVVKRLPFFIYSCFSFSLLPDKTILIDLTRQKMPFGKYQGTLLCDLPVSYLEWFNQKGFPKGRLGQLLNTIYEIKLNGLEFLLHPLKEL